MVLSWEEKVNAARDVIYHLKRYPICRDTATSENLIYFIDGKNVGKWISEQKINYRKGVLSSSHMMIWEQFIEDTEEYFGFSYALNWDKRMDALIEKTVEFSRPPASDNGLYQSCYFAKFSDGTDIGRWYLRQKRKYAASLLRSPRKERWEKYEAYLSTLPRKLTWFEKFEEVEEIVLRDRKMPNYRDKHLKFSDDSSVIGWINYQNRYFSAHTLSEERKQFWQVLLTLPWCLKVEEATEFLLESNCLESDLQGTLSSYKRSKYFSDGSSFNSFANFLIKEEKKENLLDYQQIILENYHALSDFCNQHKWNQHFLELFIKTQELGRVPHIKNSRSNYSCVASFSSGEDMGNWYYAQRRKYRSMKMDDVCFSLWAVYENYLTTLSISSEDKEILSTTLSVLFERLQMLSLIYENVPNSSFFTNSEEILQEMYQFFELKQENYQKRIK